MENKVVCEQRMGKNEIYPLEGHATACIVPYSPSKLMNSIAVKFKMRSTTSAEVTTKRNVISKPYTPAMNRSETEVNHFQNLAFSKASPIPP
jgi:hypothetical protein